MRVEHGVQVGDARGGSFLAELVRLFRAEDGASDGRSDFEVLAPLLRAGDGAANREVDPEVFWAIELFLEAAGRVIERRTGVACQAFLRLQHEGFGRIVLLAGRLAVVDLFLRDVSAFTFPSVDALAVAGERIVEEGAELVARYPEVARRT